MNPIRSELPAGLPATVLGQLTQGAYQALAAAEGALCGEAARAPTNSAQNRLFDTVARIRLGRLRLTDALAAAVAAPDTAVPGVDRERAELVDADHAVQQLRQQGGAVFDVLAPRLAVDPERLVAVVLDWTAAAGLNPQATLLVFRQFRQGVLDALPAQAAGWAQALGLVVPAVPASGAGAGQASDGALLDLLDALQQEQAQALQQAPLAAQAAGMAAVRERLAAAGLAGDKSVQETLRLVSLLFDFILQSPRLPDSVRQLVGFLQVPLAKVALLDDAFFEREGHAARKLLNQIATASLGLTPETAVPGDAVYDAMAVAVRTVLDGFGRDAAVFTDVLVAFNAALERESEQAMMAEERLRSAADLGARSDSARDTVDQRLASLLADAGLPEPVRQFIGHAWRNVLFLAFQQEGSEGDKWAQHCQTLDDLVWSVRPISGPDDRQKLLRLVPQLLKALRTGLGWAGVGQAEMDAFFKALEAMHLAQLRGKPPASAVAEAAPPAVAAPAAETGVAEEPAAAEETAAAEESLDAYLRVVDGLGMGLWVEFCEAEDKRFRCKLAAVIRHTGRYIFVNRAGVKVAEKTREELARDLRDGRIELMEDTRLFDRALESVIGGARHRKA